MRTKTLLTVCMIAAAFAGSPGAARAAEPQKEDAAFTSKLLDSIKNDDYAAFVADGTPDFQAITKVNFDQVSAQLAPRFKAGSKVVFLGQLSQHGYRVSLWKISFSDGGDDMLAKLSVKDGKVGGFWIQ